MRCLQIYIKSTENSLLIKIKTSPIGLNIFLNFIIKRLIEFAINILKLVSSVPTINLEINV